MIVATQSYETTVATIDLQILSLRASGANLMFNVAIPKFAAQAIRKIYDIGWKPIYILNNVSSSVGLVIAARMADVFTVYGYSAAQRMVAVLEQCGNNLTRENLMKRAASVHDLKLPMLLPGITVSTSADDFAPIKQMQLEKFDGNAWQLFGEVVSGSGS